MSYFGTLSYTPKEESFLKEVLNKDLGPEFLSERSGPGNTKLKYVEGWKLVNIANEVLGFNGWSNRIISQTVDYIDQANGKYSVGVSSIVRITLKDGSYHEDVGYGSMENSSKKAAALDKAKKESVTDAIKRALKHFGNVLGNSTNSKDYLKTIQKMGKQKSIPLNSSSFYRMPDFEETENTKPIAKKSTSKAKDTVEMKQDTIEESYIGDSDEDAIFLAADLEFLPQEMVEYLSQRERTDLNPNYEYKEIQLKEIAQMETRQVSKDLEVSSTSWNTSMPVPMTNLNLNPFRTKSISSNSFQPKMNGTRTCIPPVQRQLNRSKSVTDASPAQQPLKKRHIEDIPGFT